jgi:methyl-accepting chemotaxis protein
VTIVFKNLSIATRLGFAFGLVVLLLLALSVLSVERLGVINDSTKLVAADRYPKIAQANELIQSTIDDSRQLRNMLLATSEADVERAHKIIERNHADSVERLAALQKVIRSDKGRAILQEIGARRAALDTKFASLLALIKSDRKAALEFMRVDFSPVHAAYEAQLDVLIKFQADLMDGAAKDAQDNYQSTRSLVIALAAAALVLAIALATWITLSITRPLRLAVKVANALENGDLTVAIEVESRDETGQLLAAMRNMVARLTQVVGDVNSGAEALASASEEVSATAQSLSQASSEQAAGVEETSASIEQMTASISQNTDNAKVTDGMATKAAQEAAEGGEAVKATVAAMKQIAKKIGIIDDIAYQTNLLALNAAIEAARAGEHG